MTAYRRYAVFAVPHGVFYAHGAAWLGWDSVTGTRAAPPDMPFPVEPLTARPQKYGFHGTIRPPFHLADGQVFTILSAALGRLCAQSKPVHIPQLTLRQLGRFVAIVPSGDNADLTALAANVMTCLDHFRAPLTDIDLAKHRASRLSQRQEKNLQDWGYPYVQDDFRFHLTLTGPLPAGPKTTIISALTDHFSPILPAPFILNDLALMGEDAAGFFHLIRRFPLLG